MLAWAPGCTRTKQALVACPNCRNKELTNTYRHCPALPLVAQAVASGLPRQADRTESPGRGLSRSESSPLVSRAPARWLDDVSLPPPSQAYGDESPQYGFTDRSICLPLTFCARVFPSSYLVSDSSVDVAVNTPGAGRSLRLRLNLLYSYIYYSSHALLDIRRKWRRRIPILTSANVGQMIVATNLCSLPSKQRRSRKVQVRY